MTDWNETTAVSTTWDEPDIVVPHSGNEPVVSGNEWHDLWRSGVDFTPYSQAEDKDTEWTES